MPKKQKIRIIGATIARKHFPKQYIMQKKIARVVSFVGNPLLLALFCAIYANFRQFGFQKALTLTAILVLGAILPIFLYINRRVSQGNFADHDVSARTKRPSLYVFSLAVLLAMIGVLYYTRQPLAIIYGAWAGWLLAAVSFLINFKIKTSLHTGYAFLIGFLTLSFDFWTGFGLVCFAFLVGWSRLALGRHTLTEVFLGASLGCTIGTVFYQLVQ